MTTALPNPWIDPTQIEPQPFKLEERSFWHAMTGTDDYSPPLFVGAPSKEYLEALYREIAPTVYASARR